MGIFPFSCLLTVATFLPLALFVYLKNRRNITNITWALFMICVSIWSFGYYFLIIVTSENLAMFWNRIAYFGAVFIHTFFFHFVTSFLDISENKTIKKILYFLYFSSTMLFLTVFTPYFSKGVAPKQIFNYFTEPAFFYYVFFAIFAVTITLSCYLLYKQSKIETDRIKKIRIRYVLYPSIFGFIVASTNFFVVFNLRIFPLGNYFIWLYVIFITYAIFRYQLMDIEVIIKKTLVFAGLLAATLAIIILPTLIIQEFIFQGAGFGLRLLGLLISGSILIFAIRRIDDFLVNVTDKFLFQKKYDPFQLLKSFSDKVLASVLDQEAIIKIAVDLLVKALNLETFAIMLVKKEGDKYEISGSFGLGDKETAFSTSSHLITYLGKTFSPVIKKSHDRTMSGELVHDMDKIRAELCIPLVFHKHLVGLLVFGKKKSDKEYANDDLNILVPLSRDIAIAIVYARLYEEIRQKDKLATMGTLVAGIKHEIGNPLSSILTSTQLIMKEMEMWDSMGVSQKEREEKFKNTLEEVLYESRRIGRITKKFTDFAKPGDEGVKEIVNIEDSLNGALEILQNELNLKHIKIEKIIPPDTPAIFVDKDHVHQIFFNILRNAAQAIEESKKPKETSMITISVEKKVPDKVIIDISDTGLGIPEEKKKRIFEPFYTTKQKGKGTGLGLAIVRQLVGRNKGDISFKSREGAGTTFTLEFPVAKNG